MSIIKKIPKAIYVLAVVLMLSGCSSWRAPYPVRIPVRIGSADPMNAETEDLGTEIYDRGGIRITGSLEREGSMGETTLILCVENHSGKEVGISFDEMYVNGYLTAPFYTEIVDSGGRAAKPVRIDWDELGEAGIFAVHDLEFEIEIYDSKTFETLTDKESIHIKAE